MHCFQFHVFISRQSFCPLQSLHTSPNPYFQCFSPVCNVLCKFFIDIKECNKTSQNNKYVKRTRWQEYMGPLLDAVRNRDSEAAVEWSRSEHWATVEQLIAASGPSSTMMTPSSDTSAPPSAEWTCPHCTFLNLPHLTACDMCSLPR